MSADPTARLATKGLSNFQDLETQATTETAFPSAGSALPSSDRDTLGGA